jgi:putative transposase
MAALRRHRCGGQAAERRWRLVNAPHLVALVRAGAVFKAGQLLERPEDQAPELNAPAPTATGDELAAAA